MLLPMPGSPASRVTDPGTRPPPSTRSSSAMPVLRWVASSATTSPMGTGGCPGPAVVAARAARVRSSSSTSVPHASHVGQRPSHCGVEPPHSVQRWTVRVLVAMATTLRPGYDSYVAAVIHPALVVGFDLDMTLVDSRPGIVATLEALQAESGAPVAVDGMLDALLRSNLDHEFAAALPRRRGRGARRSLPRALRGGRRARHPPAARRRRRDRRGARRRRSHARRHREVRAQRAAVPRPRRPRGRRGVRLALRRRQARDPRRRGRARVRGRHPQRRARRPRRRARPSSRWRPGPIPRANCTTRARRWCSARWRSSPPGSRRRFRTCRACADPRAAGTIRVGTRATPTPTGQQQHDDRDARPARPPARPARPAWCSAATTTRRPRCSPPPSPSRWCARPAGRRPPSPTARRARPTATPGRWCSRRPADPAATARAARRTSRRCRAGRGRWSR